MIISISQIPTYAELNQQDLGKYELVYLDKMTKGLDVSRFNLEKNDLQIKFPHKIQGDLINKLAEKRIEKATLDEQQVYVLVSLDSKESLSKLNKFKITGYNENLAILHVSEKEISNLVLIDSVKTVGLPDEVEKLSHLTTEGVSFMGADQMKNAGYTGNGTKIAVIDASVDPTDPEFSANVVYSHLYDSANNCAGSITCGDPRHGDAVSEIIVDMAPNVSLYLYAIRNNVDFANAVDDAISKDVDIISASIGFPTSGSNDTSNFRDGHSSVAKKINQASDAGILSVIASGNDGNKHWKGTYSANSTIANSLGLTGSGYESVNIFNQSASGNLKACLPVVNSGTPYTLTWNNWPTTNQDYDLLFYNSTMTKFYGATSSRQTGTQSPMDRIQVTGIASICIVIASYNSDENATFHFYTNSNDLNNSFEVRSGSIGTPADATGALAVGAVNVSNNLLEGFSSSGPTDDSRNKPEVCGVDNTFSHQYSPSKFFGTSAATPHVAGTAALILEQNTLLSVSELKNKITGNVIQSTYSVDNLCGANSGVTNLDSLATPHDLISTVKSATEIDLSWSNYTTATSYKIERESPVGGGFLTLVANTGNTNTTYNNTGLTAGTQYNYRVSAIIPSGTTNPSNESSAITNATAPSAITDLAATAGNTQITLIWTAPNNGGSPITDYIVEFSPFDVSSGNPTASIDTASGSGTPGCENTVDGCYIPNSATVSFGGTVTFHNTDTAAHTFTAGTGGGGPTGIFDSGLVLAGHSFEWTATTAGVIPYFCMVHPWMTGTITVGTFGPYTVFADGTSATTGATVTGLTNGLSYDFQVNTVNVIGTSLPSNIVTSIPVTVPDAITDLAATSENIQVTLTWTAPDNGGSSIMDYVIQYKNSTDISYTIFADSISASTGATVTGLTNGLSYDFQVSAVNSVGTALVSNTESATLMLLCPTEISGELIIISSCTIIGNVIAPDNVHIQNNAIVTIENGGSLDIDFASKFLMVHSGSKVLIKSGGKIF